MTIDNYTDGIEMKANVKKIKDWVDQHHYEEKVIFAMRKEDEVLTSRGIKPRTRNMQRQYIADVSCR